MRIFLILAVWSVTACSTIVRAGDVWRRGPREAYNPETYCNWNRSGLPPAQQAICEARDKKQPASKSRWEKIEADNGAIYAVEVGAALHHPNGARETVTCTVENNKCLPLQMNRFYFDCRGHFQDLINGGGAQMAPPRSVVGRMATLVCSASSQQ